MDRNPPDFSEGQTEGRSQAKGQICFSTLSTISHPDYCCSIPFIKKRKRERKWRGEGGRGGGKNPPHTPHPHPSSFGCENPICLLSSFPLSPPLARFFFFCFLPLKVISDRWVSFPRWQKGRAGGSSHLCVGCVFEGAMLSLCRYSQ